MNKEISVNFRLCILFAIVNLLLCCLAGFLLLFTSFYLWGDLKLLFTKGIVDETLWGSLIMSFFSVLCFILELGFIWLIFFWINPQKERVFWMFSTFLFSIAFVIMIISAIDERRLDNQLICGLFYCAFYMVGSIFALIRVNKFIKRLNNNHPLPEEI
ncbi:MAG: hypothetical protein JWR38_3061 [Mucilaginibacter sp.]|nr:hypothetical protein [Mucilaginibacter sp.]